MESLQGLTPEVQTQLLDYLLSFVSEHKKSLFQDRILHRTHYLTIVLENVYQPHNNSAVLRSCDCFGIQDVHIIENRSAYSVNPEIALGASQWLTLNRYNMGHETSGNVLKSLKRNGYRIAATTPHREDFTPENLPMDQPLALVFGTEKEGLGPEVLQQADIFVRIPMNGFTESLNISVSAGILLHTLVTRLRNSEIQWRLSPGKAREVMIGWACSVVKTPELLIRNFLDKMQ